MQALPVEDPFATRARTVDPKARFLKMQGAAVVRFTARAVPLAIDTALQRAGVSAEDIDWVVPHQANLRILDVIAKRYHLPRKRSMSIWNISATPPPQACRSVWMRCAGKGLLTKDRPSYAPGSAGA